jgi:hypothetical protein
MGATRTAARVSPVILSVLFASGGARADGVAEAEDLFRRGKDLMNASKPAEACPLFAESQRLDPQTGTLLNLALCHEAIGNVGAAWGEFNVVEQQSLTVRPPREDRALVAREHAAKLAPRLSRLKLVAPQAPAPGEVVKVDGEVRGAPSWSVGIIVDVGTRSVEVSAPGKKAKTLTVEIPREGTVATLTLPPLEAAPPSAAESRDTVNGARRTTGFLVGGVGLAVVAAGAAFGIAAIVNNNEARSCPQTCFGDSPAGQQSDLATNRALVFANIANVLVPLGAVGAAVGGWLVFTSGRTTVGAPVVSRDGATLGVRGTW